VFGFILRFANRACVTRTTLRSSAKLAARWRSTWWKCRRRVFPKPQRSASATSSTARTAELCATPSLLLRQSTSRRSAASLAMPARSTRSRSISPQYTFEYPVLRYTRRLSIRSDKSKIRILSMRTLLVEKTWSVRIRDLPRRKF
jgi:hypothetical protein